MSTFLTYSGAIFWIAIILFVFPGPGLFLVLSWLSERSSERKDAKRERKRKFDKGY